MQGDSLSPLPHPSPGLPFAFDGRLKERRTAEQGSGGDHRVEEGARPGSGGTPEDREVGGGAWASGRNSGFWAREAWLLILSLPLSL